MSTERLRAEQFEDAALESLFQRGVQLRLYIAPFVFLGALVLVASDATLWRMVLVGIGVLFALVRIAVEVVRVRRDGFHRARLATFLPVPATLLILVVSCTGGVESPIMPMLPLVTVFLSLFLRPRVGFFFAGITGAAVWILTAVAYRGLVAEFIPQVFGGGPRLANDWLLFSRALFVSLGLFWASIVGWVMRRAFQSAIQRAVDAHEQVLETQKAGTRTLTTLAAEIAHELKNPLASVKGLAALVDRESEGKAKERLTILRQEADRMQEILESFLTFSRPLVPLELAPVKLADVVGQVVAMHEGMASERGVMLRVDLHPDATVKADARKLTQVLINLVQNALDVTKPGEAVDFVLSREAHGARVLVMDRGEGVKDPERAFEPGVTTKAHGHGLGLTISRLLARQHGGEVRLVPRDGGGTVAELSLPEAPP